ncbi:MAG: hypothetical protein R8G66_13155 [Cytophagales bacterium]|nr:hypothetical protein [Cytophagales bacterium]
MKRLLLLPIFYVLLTATVFAQESDDPVSFKKNYTGLAFRGGWGRSFGFVGDMELRYGRFINPHWLVGAAVDFRSNTRFEQQAFGAFARYYFNKKQKGFFVEASYKAGIAQQQVVDSFTNQVLDITSGSMYHTFIGAGYAMVNKKNFGLELFAGWESTRYNLSHNLSGNSTISLDQGFTSGIRFQYKF